MATVRSEKGAALVTALMLTMLSLVIALSLLYMVTSETRISASQKRYRTALAAAQGGLEVFTVELIPQLLLPEARRDLLEERFALVNLQLPQYDCLRQKLEKGSADWSEACRQRAGADPAAFPDAVFRLGSDRPNDRGFSVATKIVDTVPGNSDSSGMDLLDPGSSVSGRDEIIHPQHVPGIYSISVQGARDGGSDRERARLSVLYAY